MAATIDCASLPPGTADLALPDASLLLFFGFPEEFDEVHARGEIRLAPSLSPPYLGEAEAFAETWAEHRGGRAARFLFGGYGLTSPRGAGLTRWLIVIAFS
ncbi:hypothetical protein ACFWNN_42085 [Lentzea sp. NPDC058450]|uniref:hypothetical protein n=1 Tax=Lentzea sp. NPDC058450 TaxID=3346505 RepID=UPI003652F7D8